MFCGELIIRTGAKCACPGMNVTINCSSSAGAFALIWDGSALRNSDCRMIFFSSVLSTEGPVTETCNAGNISMYTYKKQNHTISVLNIIAWTGLTGMAINCSESNTTNYYTPLGTHSLRICGYGEYTLLLL